jgi:hypothetical protein
VTDVNRISNGANTKTHSSIRFDFQYFVGPTKGHLILVLGTLAQHDLIIDVIGMRDSRFVFVFIALLNQMLFTCADVLPVGRVLDIEYHVLETFAMWYGK